VAYICKVIFFFGGDGNSDTVRV